MGKFRLGKQISKKEQSLAKDQVREIVRVEKTTEFRPDNDKVDSIKSEVDELRSKLESFSLVPQESKVIIKELVPSPVDEERFNKIKQKFIAVENESSSLSLKIEEVKRIIKDQQQLNSVKHEQSSKHNERQNQLVLDIHKKLEDLDQRLKKQVGMSVFFDHEIAVLNKEVKKQMLGIILLGLGLITLIAISM